MLYELLISGGWGVAMLMGAAMTAAVAVTSFVIGLPIGALLAAGRLSQSWLPRWFAGAYLTVLRGVPELLVIYLLFFGGSQMLGALLAPFREARFLELPTFAVGTVAIGLIVAAFHAEVMRGAYLSIAKGEIEAARAIGMSRGLAFRRIILPQALAYALPGFGNVWQNVLKVSALVSVIGIEDTMRQAAMAAGATKLPFLFYAIAALLFLCITYASGRAFKTAERRFGRGVYA